MANGKAILLLKEDDRWCVARVVTRVWQSSQNKNEKVEKFRYG